MRQRGQVIVLFSVFLIVLMVLAGSAYDYASIVTDDARLQNAVDAAALAGSNALNASAGQSGTTPVAIASATAGAYLSANGVNNSATPNATVVMTFPTSTPAPGAPTPVVPLHENIELSVTQNHRTAFWPLVGLSNVTMSDAGSAHAARSMVDVMLSLDTTGSEVISGSLQSIQQAVGAFVTTMNPSTSDPRGPQIGIARFAGIQCQYDSHGNYNQGCVNDQALLTPLTNDHSVLLAVANGPSTSPCPVGDYAKGGCPIEHVYYNASNRATSVSASHDPFSGSSPYSPGYTGTKLPNGFSVLGITGTTTPYGFGTNYAWSTANNGRNNSTANSPLNARKVMVMMTDGQDEMWPLPGPGGLETVATYDQQIQDMANALQKGPDGVAGTNDDVEIYVVGYFCTDYPNGFCQSKLASVTPHACPGPTMPANASAIDVLLNTVASSTPGTCDHYYPLGKSETLQTLPGLFQALAGRISRGQLTQ